MLHSITARFCLRSYDSAICRPFFKHLSRDYEKTTITAMYHGRWFAYKQTNKYLYCQSYTPVKAEQLTLNLIQLIILIGNDFNSNSELQITIRKKKWCSTLSKKGGRNTSHALSEAHWQHSAIESFLSNTFCSISFCSALIYRWTVCPVEYA